jgi:hypothetical protein
MVHTMLNPDMMTMSAEQGRGVLTNYRAGTPVRKFRLLVGQSVAHRQVGAVFLGDCVATWLTGGIHCAPVVTLPWLSF